MLDVPGNLSILNNSKWGHTQAITVENKAALLQHLILEEVIVRQEDNLKAFIRGLEQLGLQGLIKAYPTLVKPLFTCQDQAPLTADQFWMLIGSVRPGSDDEKSKAFDFFHDLVDYLEGMYIVDAISCKPNCCIDPYIDIAL